jgi:signal transduction histidine kinase/putative methionine-R-sulfoxide reductase with GAF domain/HAMP domain-containing protein
MAMRRALFSLQARLLLLVLFALVPAFGLTLYSAAADRQRAMAEVQQNALRLVWVAASDHGRLIESAHHVLIVLAQLPPVRGRDPTACNALFVDLIRQYPLYAGFAAVTPKGDVFCSAPSPDAPVNFADRAWFQQVVHTRAFTVSSYQIGRISGKAIVVLASPLLDEEGRLQAVVSIGLDLAWLNQLAAEAQLPAGAILMVVDRTGTILARHPDAEGWVGRSAPDAAIVRAILARQGEGTTEAVGIDGVPRLYAFTPLRLPAGTGSAPDENEAYVSIGIPRRVAFAEIDRTLARNLVGLGMVALLALAAAWVGGQVFILRQVRELSAATQRLAAGDLSARSELAHDLGELSELGRTFNRMAEALEQRESERREAESERAATLESLRESEQRYRSLYATVQRQARELTLLDQVRTALARELDPPALFHAVVEAIASAFGYTGVSLYLLQDDELVLQHQVGHDSPLARIPLTRGISGRVARTGRPVLLEHGHSDPELLDVLEGIAPAVCVPLFDQGRVVGTLNVESAQSAALTEADLRLMVALSEQIGVAISKARLYAEARQRAHYLALLNDITRTAVGALSFQEMLQTLADRLGELLDADGCYIALWDEDSQMAIPAAAYGPLRATYPTLRAEEGETTMTASVLRAGHALVAEDVFHSPYISPRIAAQLPTRSMLGLPLIAGGQKLGAALIAFNRPHRFTSDEIARGEQAAGQIALAVAKMRLWEAERAAHQEAAARAAELQARNEELDAFAHTVAHGLKNPLSLILGYVETLAEGYAGMPADEMRMCLETIARNGQKMRNIVDELLLLAEVRKRDVELQPLDMAKIAAEACDRLVYLAAERRGEIIVPGEWPTALGYAPWAEEVWVNYLSNALKYGGQGDIVPPRVEIGAAAQADGMVRFWVRDNGPGLTAEEQARLFVPFTRLDQARAQGHGLGLSIVRRIVEKLGGQVGVESQVGQGSVFSFTLPLS